MEEDKRQNSVSEHGMDRLSTFMFGDKRPRRAPKEIEEPEENQTSSIIQPQRPDWILGHRRKELTLQTKDTENSIEQLLNGVDQQLLFETIDTVATFMKKMKPLFQEIKPHFNSMMTKFTKK